MRGFILAALIAATPLPAGAVPTPPEPVAAAVAAEARAGLEAILDLWREGKLKEVYERAANPGTKTREAFVQKLSSAGRRPACCWQKLQEPKVSVRGDSAADVRGTFGLEEEGGTVEPMTRTVRVVKEDGVWKLRMADILAFAGEKGSGKRKKKR